MWPRPQHTKPRPDDGKMYTARTAVKYIWQLHRQDPASNLYKVANELIECGLIAVSRDNVVKRYLNLLASIKDGKHEDAAALKEEEEEEEVVVVVFTREK